MEQAGLRRSEMAVRGRQRPLPAIAVVAQKNADVEDPGASDLYEIGVVAKIIKLMRMPDGTTTVIIQGKRRLRIGEIVHHEPYLRAKVTAEPDEKIKDDK